MIKCAFYLDPDGRLLDQLNIGQLRNFWATGEGLLWVDIENTTSEDGQFLSDVLHFHPLAVADCVSKNIHPPKIDEFEDYLFIIVHGINYQTEFEVVKTTELCLFFGKNFVVTSHDVPMRSVTSVLEQVQAEGRPMRKGADFLAHDLMNALVDNIMLCIDELNEKCADIEAEVLQVPKRETLASIMQFKRSTLALERVMSPQREIMNSLSRGDYPLITGRAQIYYRDIYDHLVHIEMLTQSLRDLADSVLNTYLSSVSNSQNEVMKVLSIVAAIFLPLTLLAGIYGMNFANMPELDWKYGYFAVWGIMVLVAISMVVYFKRRRWF
jgi:magnesium transporter